MVRDFCTAHNPPCHLAVTGYDLRASMAVEFCTLRGHTLESLPEAALGKWGKEYKGVAEIEVPVIKDGKLE